MEEEEEDEAASFPSWTLPATHLRIATYVSLKLAVCMPVPFAMSGRSSLRRTAGMRRSNDCSESVRTPEMTFSWMPCSGFKSQQMREEETRGH